MSTQHYPRDMVGYGGKPPYVNWPKQAKIAVQFVLNYEEGGESCVLDGDAGSEQFLSEILGAQSYPDRHMSMESIYEYGSRAGVWRILKEFEKRQLPLTVFAVAKAMQRNPELVAYLKQTQHEIACHGLKWLHYQNISPDIEQQHIKEGLKILSDLFGQMPLGWYTGRDSPNTRQLLVEHGGLLYDSDYYGDDLPFWTEVETATGKQPHLVVPYTLDCNDMRFATAQGFNSGTQFFDYLRDSFDVLYAEGSELPKMMSIGLHCRLAGRPGRFKALQRFLDYIQTHDDIWICSRLSIAQHWKQYHPFKTKELM